MGKLPKMTKTHIDIGILKHPRVQLAAVYGLTDIFLTANRIARDELNLDKPEFRISHWDASGLGSDPKLSYCDTDKLPNQLQVLIVPGQVESLDSWNANKTCLRWIKAHYDAGTIATSVCKGAYTLAECGILDGRNVTTHWGFEQDFSDRFPQIILNIDRIIQDDGDIITAGGVMAWMDLGLHLVGKYLGPSVVLSVSKFLLVDPPRREQRYYNNFAPRFDHGDDLVLKAQRWMQANFQKPVALEKIANAATTSERTLIRRYKSVLDMSPTKYLQQLRIARARELLESTAYPVSKISWEVGYEDVNSLRKQFKDIVGLTPSEYRQRFGK